METSDRVSSSSFRKKGNDSVVISTEYMHDSLSILFQVPTNGGDAIAGRYICHPNGPKSFECLKCFRRFTQKTTVVDHVRYYCGKPPGYACSFCGFRAMYSSSVYTHIRKSHWGVQATVIRLFEKQRIK